MTVGQFGNASEQASALAEKVAFLSAMPGVAQVIETNMAYVFLTSDHAFKMKKPVAFGYFDHRSLAGRAAACEAELRLNRDLAGDVYIGTVPLLRVENRLTLCGEGTVVDWLVHMKRLPAHRMLDAVIGARQGPTTGEIESVVAHLAQFYARQQARRRFGTLYLEHLQREQAVNVAHLTELAHLVPDQPLSGANDVAGSGAALRTVQDSGGAVPRDRPTCEGTSVNPASGAVAAGSPASRNPVFGTLAIRDLLSDLDDRLARAQADIAARDAAGLIIEGHGDLRPEHVCLTDPPVIFDRVETALEMRVIDVFDEIGYLGAECALLGRPDLGPLLTTGLQKAGFAPPPPWLMATYGMFRLVTRARLALDHLRDPNPRTPAKWPVRARDCLAEAARLSREHAVAARV